MGEDEDACASVRRYCERGRIELITGRGGGWVPHKEMMQWVRVQIGIMVN